MERPVEGTDGGGALINKTFVSKQMRYCFIMVDGKQTREGRSIKSSISAALNPLFHHLSQTNVAED